MIQAAQGAACSKDGSELASGPCARQGRHLQSGGHVKIAGRVTAPQKGRYILKNPTAVGWDFIGAAQTFRVFPDRSWPIRTGY
jgi:hypothetical protein